MSHKYHLVINNPTSLDYEAIEAVVKHQAYKAHLMNEENAPTTGTFHIHLYIQFKKKISFYEIKGMFKRAHIEVYTGDVLNIKEYIAKDEVGEKMAMQSWGNSIDVKNVQLKFSE